MPWALPVYPADGLQLPRLPPLDPPVLPELAPPLVDPVTLALLVPVDEPLLAGPVVVPFDPEVTVADAVLPVELAECPPLLPAVEPAPLLAAAVTETEALTDPCVEPDAVPVLAPAVPVDAVLPAAADEDAAVVPEGCEAGVPLQAEKAKAAAAITIE